MSDVESLAGLSKNEQRAVEDLVAAIVRRDAEALLTFGAPKSSNPWLWIDEYSGRGFEPVTPPGDVASWPGTVLRRQDGSVSVDVTIFGRVEGVTDLTIEIELRIDAKGVVRPTFLNLHVL